MMFNFHSRQYVFRQSGGEIWNFFCDSRQNLCYNTLTSRGSWSNASVLFRNVYPYFYADMDEDGCFHILYQDNEGTIHYSRLDGQTAKSAPLLNSRAPSAYNKQLFLAPFRNNVHFFYVLQHENSFLLAYQTLANSKAGSPRVVDHVSGSSLPCAVIYDKSQNIYAFYQAYDGKYLQLGYKKLNTAQKSLSEFTAVTKYAGTCEYPHVLIDDGGIIHLCYQRRAPKNFEMVYQQKHPDRNLWSSEEIIHTSAFSFENASILQEKENMIIYWVRDEIIYYSSSPKSGNNWTKAARHSFSAGRNLGCISCKAGSSKLPPVFYPGTLSNGIRTAFSTNDTALDLAGNAKDVSELLGFTGTSSMTGSSGFYAGSGTQGSSNPSGSSGLFGGGGTYGSSGFSGSSGSSGGDIRSLVLDAFKQLQNSMDEVRDGSSSTREELSRLKNAYEQLSKEIGKYSIRLNMLESQLSQTKKTRNKTDNAAVKNDSTVGRSDSTAMKTESSGIKPESGGGTILESSDNVLEDPDQAVKPVNTHEQSPAPSSKADRKPLSSLDPDKLKAWEEWEEPKEWQEG